MTRLVPDVLASPAVAVLCELENAGLDLVVVGDRLRVWPTERLTPEREQTIRQHRDALKVLVSLCDDGVQVRREVFAQQAAEAPVSTVPRFVLRAGVPYTKGLCFACGEALPEPRFGRCWRCALAWRLALRVPISAELGAVYDGAPVVA